MGQAGESGGKSCLESRNGRRREGLEGQKTRGDREEAG